MKNIEIKKFTIDELKKKASGLKKELFNFRFRKVNGQLVDTAKVSVTRKDLAKVLTAINKKG